MLSAVNIEKSFPYEDAEVTVLKGVTVHLDEGDYALLRRDSVVIYDKDGNQVERPRVQAVAGALTVDKGNHRHFMHKEIHEQPEVVSHTLALYIDMATLETQPPDLGIDLEPIVIGGRGGRPVAVERASHQVMGEDELQFRIARRQGLLQPVVLLLAEREVAMVGIGGKRNDAGRTELVGVGRFEHGFEAQLVRAAAGGQQTLAGPLHHERAAGRFQIPLGA